MSGGNQIFFLLLFWDLLSLSLSFFSLQITSPIWAFFFESSVLSCAVESIKDFQRSACYRYNLKVLKPARWVFPWTSHIFYLQSSFLFELPSFFVLAPPKIISLIWLFNFFLIGSSMMWLICVSYRCWLVGLLLWPCIRRTMWTWVKGSFSGNASPTFFIWALAFSILSLFNHNMELLL